MVADAHAHVIVAEVLRDAAPGEAWRPRVWREDGAQVVELDGRPIRSAVREFCDLDGILAAQEAFDRVLLCPWVPLLFGDVEPAAALERARIQNAGLERMVRERPDRVSALGAVPLQAPELAAAELTELMAGGVLSGVELPAAVGGESLGHPRFEPFWAAAEATGALVFIHPTTRGFDAPAFSRHYLWNTVGNPFETTVAAAEMVLGGVLERHPRLRVLLAHGGGALLALRGRLRYAHSFQPQAREDLVEDPVESIRRFHFDTVTHDPRLLRDLVDFAGPERVLLGTDHPFDMADPDPLGTLRGACLDPEAERLIAGGNLERLLGREPVEAR
jgi:aminocarboxymuconate-semialdehyde decarboxylase